MMVVPTTNPAVSAPKPYAVANTGGVGVYIRQSPKMADRIKAWPDSTLMSSLGEVVQSEDREWRKVRDPDGTVGWVPSEYLVPLPETSSGRSR